MIEVMLAAVNWLAGMIVVAEALNKLERLSLRRMRLSLSRAVQFLAWSAIAIGGGGAVIHPLLDVPPPQRLGDVCALAGLAIVIVHCRYLQWRKGE